MQKKGISVEEENLMKMKMFLILTIEIELIIIN